MPDDIVLNVGGTEHGGWKSLAVTRSLEELAGSFDLTVSDRWPGSTAGKRIAPGDACTVSLGGELLVSGYVDDVRPRIDADSHEVAFKGRDRTADLVDCSPALEPGEWRNLQLTQLVAAIAEPFGIAVTSQVSVGEPFATFRLEQGETAFEAIDRAARQRKVLATSDGAGGLVLTRAGAGARAAVALRVGDNVLSGEAVYSQRDRFSTYVIKGQQPGDDAWGETTAAHVRAEARDPGIRRHRPMTLIADQPGGEASQQARVEWEARTRAARGRRVEISVQGWRQGEAGPLWRPNVLVDCHHPDLGVETDLLVSSVTFERGGNGTITRLSLLPADAFLPEPVELTSKGGTDLWLS
ncbi:MAG: hypothetical protein WD341_08860 [Tistlia sp.]|uniref:phage baseplate assembly protein n=1 Tax=Tistlia sp. TaxID=3057121 RepID=UPI0034A4BDB4